jgi:hypothetical protein
MGHFLDLRLGGSAGTGAAAVRSLGGAGLAALASAA